MHQKKTNLLVIEPKRTEDGAHMELKAVRYTSITLALTSDKMIEISDYCLKKE